MSEDEDERAPGEVWWYHLLGLSQHKHCPCQPTSVSRWKSCIVNYIQKHSPDPTIWEKKKRDVFQFFSRDKLTTKAESQIDEIQNGKRNRIENTLTTTDHSNAYIYGSLIK